MNLEEGKIYLTRDGRMSDPVQKLEKPTGNFEWAANINGVNKTYKSDGHYLASSDANHLDDLVEEVLAKGAFKTLELGKKYLTRAGRIVGPLEADKNQAQYPFSAMLDEVKTTWAADGKYIVDHKIPNEKDIVEIVTAREEIDISKGMPTTEPKVQAIIATPIIKPSLLGAKPIEINTNVKPNSPFLHHKYPVKAVEAKPIETPKNNPVEPNHYKQGGIECIEALEAATTNLKGWEAGNTWNAIKYLWRWKEKNGIEDLKKAIWYINRLIQKLENPNDSK